MDGPTLKRISRTELEQSRTQSTADARRSPPAHLKARPSRRARSTAAAEYRLRVRRSPHRRVPIEHRRLSLRQRHPAITFRRRRGRLLRRSDAGGRLALLRGRCSLGRLDGRSLGGYRLDRRRRSTERCGRGWSSELSLRSLLRRRDERLRRENERAIGIGRIDLSLVFLRSLHAIRKSLSTRVDGPSAGRPGPSCS